MTYQIRVSLIFRNQKNLIYCRQISLIISNTPDRFPIWTCAFKANIHISKRRTRYFIFRYVFSKIQSFFHYPTLHIALEKNTIVFYQSIHLKMNSIPKTPIQLYKYLLRQIPTLPPDSQSYYRNYIKGVRYFEILIISYDLSSFRIFVLMKMKLILNVSMKLYKSFTMIFNGF